MQFVLQPKGRGSYVGTNSWMSGAERCEERWHMNPQSKKTIDQYQEEEIDSKTHHNIVLSIKEVRGIAIQESTPKHNLWKT